MNSYRKFGLFQSLGSGKISSSLRTVAVAITLAAMIPASAQITTRGNPAQGTWTPMANSAPEECETALLMTDGSVFVKSFGDFSHCWKITPGPNADYVNGTWTTLPSMPVGLIYGPCQTLKDGRLFIAGGEYLSNSSDYNTCEVYDPVANKWTQGPDGLFGDIGDTGNTMMADGRVLVSTRFSMATQIFDPSTMTWSATGNMTSFTGDEESWQQLPDGSILNVFLIGQRFLPSTGQWMPTAAMPTGVNLVDAAFEIGPAVRLYDGRVITFGGTNQNAIYTPPTTLTGAGSWVAAPVTPSSLSCPDCPACVMPNGIVLLIATTTDFAGPNFFEYDPVANSFAAITGPPNNFNEPSFTIRFLALPNGQIMMTGWGPTPWLYTPAGGVVQTTSKAHLTSLTRNGSIYTLQGTQLNGATAGGSYGDDASMNTNFPIVQLKNTANGKIYFGRSFNFSTMGVGTGNALESCQFTIPSSVPQGNYTISTWASGLPSSNSIGVGTALAPTAVSIYSNQGQNATGGIPQLLTIDQNYYTVNSVTNSVGEVAAAQINFNVGSANNVFNLATALTVQAPKGGTNFVYFWNFVTNQFDLLNTTATDGLDHAVTGSSRNAQNYINGSGVVIVVDRVVFPPRLNAPIYTLKIDFCSVTN